ncbi:MAG: alpha/beta fold hydrolase, partial [Ilumatobacteraceae bacterium]
MTVPAGARIEPGTAGDDGVAAVEWSTVEAPLATVTAGTGSTIVFVHGFTQTGQSWRPIAEHFVRHHHRCVLVDLPGHGGSTDVRADLPSSASLVAASVASVATTATFVGYSLGSRVCLHLAVAHAQFVERLVLVGAHPGLEDDADRADRRAADERLAERVLAIGVLYQGGFSVFAW